MENAPITGFPTCFEDQGIKKKNKIAAYGKTEENFPIH
jgi:hypothetical protein